MSKVMIELDSTYDVDNIVLFKLLMKNINSLNVIER